MSPRMNLDSNIVLQKAVELIDEKGLDQLSISLLAKELNIRPPSLYNHVNSLSELKQALAIQGLHKLHQYMMKAAIGKSGDEAIRSISKSYVQFVRVHPGLYDATNRFTHSEDIELQQAQKMIVDLVLQVFEFYHLQQDMAIHMVRGLRSILHGFTSIEQMGGFGIPLNLDDSLSILINTFIEGIHSVARSTTD
ncbi:WHG domain-containing protein [Rummeliibacillus pycnus]|uniref:TetR/AcrR family transcriptional regulator n=1 Tax=Rummeliibacillus pycnus TaxID=101070 RepID=UPI003D2AC723